MNAQMWFCLPEQENSSGSDTSRDQKQINPIFRRQINPTEFAVVAVRMLSNRSTTASATII